MTYAYKIAPATEGSLYSLLSPCLTAMGGVLFLGESFSVRGVIGGVFVISSCLFVALTPPSSASGSPTGE